MDIVDFSIEFIMKRKGFVKDNDGWRRKFVFVTVENGQWKISHSVEFRNGKTTNFEFEEMDDWIKYFDRI